MVGHRDGWSQGTSLLNEIFIDFFAGSMYIFAQFLRF